MENDDRSEVPANVRRGAETNRRRWDDKLIRAALEFLARKAQELESTGAPFAGYDLTGRMLELAADAGVPRSTRYRRIGNGDWHETWLTDMLGGLVAELIEEHRFRPELEVVQSPRYGVDRLLLGLALYAARPRTGPAARTQEHHGARNAGALIGLALDVLLQAGRELTADDISRVRKHRQWLTTLEATNIGAPAIAGTGHRLAGFLAGWDAREQPPLHAPVHDYAGYWPEGVIEALAHRSFQRDRRRASEALNLLHNFATGPAVEPAADGSPHRSVLSAAEYAIELLVVRILAGPAHSPVVHHARKIAESLLDQLDAWTADGRLPAHEETFLVRRANAARHFIRRNWPAALMAAVMRNGERVRPEVEHEYAFGLLAAITHEAQGALDDEQERHTKAFLAEELRRGRGPFLAAPVRDLAHEVGHVPDVPALASTVSALVPDESIKHLEAAVQRLAIARAFNATDEHHPRESLTELAQRLRENARRVESAAMQLELLAEDD